MKLLEFMYEYVGKVKTFINQELGWKCFFLNI